MQDAVPADDAAPRVFAGAVLPVVQQVQQQREEEAERAVAQSHHIEAVGMVRSIIVGQIWDALVQGCCCVKCKVKNCA